MFAIAARRDRSNYGEFTLLFRPMEMLSFKAFQPVGPMHIVASSGGAGQTWGTIMTSAFAEYLIATGRTTREQLSAAAPEGGISREPIGRLAMLHGLLSPSDIDEILSQQSAQECLFGEIAVRLGMLKREQLDILVRGQSIRACLELVEDLALAGAVDFASGLEAIKEYISGEHYAQSHAHGAPSTM